MSATPGVRLSKPAPPHNQMLAPALCMCVGCCHKVLALQCPASRDGVRCGDYKGHRGMHTMLPATEFVIAAERVRVDSPEAPR